MSYVVLGRYTHVSNSNKHPGEIGILVRIHHDGHIRRIFLMLKRQKSSVCLLVLLFFVSTVSGFRVMATMRSVRKLHALPMKPSILGGAPLRSRFLQPTHIVRGAHTALFMAVQEGDKVVLPDGRVGLVCERAKNGWCTVDIGESHERIKLRSNTLKPVLQPHQPFGQQQSQQRQPQQTQQLTYLSQCPPLHEKMQKWIGFSDLHVHSRTIDTCLQVLDTVHETALQNNAGVLFLGDWWHVRGSLLVQQLNEIMRHLSTWDKRVPVVMIPGNHDQVCLVTLTYVDFTLVSHFLWRYLLVFLGLHRLHWVDHFIRWNH